MSVPSEQPKADRDLLRRYHEAGETLMPAGPAERLEMGLRHLALLSADAGPEAAAREMRKHVAWYIKGLPGSARVREQVNHTRSAPELTELLTTYLVALERQGLEAFTPEPMAEGAPPCPEALLATG